MDQTTVRILDSASISAVRALFIESLSMYFLQLSLSLHHTSCTQDIVL